MFTEPKQHVILEYMIFHCHFFTSVKQSSCMMTCSKHVWYLVLNNPKKNSNRLYMWELWVIYKNLLYNDEFWFIFHLKKREKHHFHDTILTMDWTPEMCQNAGFSVCSKRFGACSIWIMSCSNKMKWKPCLNEPFGCKFYNCLTLSVIFCYFRWHHWM